MKMEMKRGGKRELKFERSGEDGVNRDRKDGF